MFEQTREKARPCKHRYAALRIVVRGALRRRLPGRRTLGFGEIEVGIGGAISSDIETEYYYCVL